MPTGAIPWGKAGPDPSFYNADSNPFVFKGDQSQNKNNPIGSVVTINSVNTIPPLGTRLSMVPFLSVAETRPVESLLDIYWETSLSGSLVTLNGLVNSQSNGITGSNFEAASFPESILASTQIGFGFNFLNGAGQFIPASQITLNSFTIKDGDTPPNTLGAIFTLTKNAQQTAFAIKATAGDFFYSDAIAAAPLTGVYTITANVTFNGEAAQNVVLAPLTLTNVAPAIDNFTQPTVTTPINSNIITLTAKNGSANAAVNTTELDWYIDSVSPASEGSKFSIANGVLENTQVLSNNIFYSISIKATDLSGNGLDSPPASVQFQTGTAVSNRVNIALCEGWLGGSLTGCGASLGVLFGAAQTPTSVPTSSVVVFNSAGNSGSSETYPANNATNSYNVLQKNPTTEGDFGQPRQTNDTGALVQGTLYITPTLTNIGGSGNDDDTIRFTIQFYDTANSAWIQATDSSNNVIRNITLQVAANNTVSSKKVFDTPGEYRVLTSIISGFMCTTDEPTGTSFKVNFGDDLYANCFGAPL